VWGLQTSPEPPDRNSHPDAKVVDVIRDVILDPRKTCVVVPAIVPQELSFSAVGGRSPQARNIASFERLYPMRRVPAVCIEPVTLGRKADIRWHL
jgi:hypothetical protein